MKQPSNLKELQAFAGLTCWCKKWIPRYSEKMSPIYEAMKIVPGQKVTWSLDCNTAWETIKEAICSKPVLAVPTFSEKHPLTIYCDASSRFYAACLTQKDDHGVERPIAFWSKKTNTSQQAFCSADAEAQCLVLSCQEFHKYISHRKFVVRTDARASKSLLGFGQQLNARRQRWAMVLSQYQMEIEYIPGKDLFIDGLSRQESGDQEMKGNSGNLVTEEKVHVVYKKGMPRF